MSADQAEDEREMRSALVFACFDFLHISSISDLHADDAKSHYALMMSP